MTLDESLNQLIIIAGQWRDSEDKVEHEQLFHQRINRIQEVTGKSREDVVQALLHQVGKELEHVSDHHR